MEPSWYKNIDSFVKLPFGVMSITSISNKNKTFQITPSDKLVYCYMLSRIRYFCWECGGSYYDKQEDISEELGIGLQVVRRSVKKLVECDILIGKKIRRDGRLKWVFSDIRDITTFAVQQPTRYFNQNDSSIDEVVKGEQDSSFDVTRNRLIDFPPAF